MNILVVHQHNLLWLRRQAHIPDRADRQTQGFTVDAFAVSALRSEDLATIEDGLEELHVKLSAMEEEATMFLSNTPQLLEGLVAQITFLHSLVSSSLQEFEEYTPCHLGQRHQPAEDLLGASKHHLHRE